MDAGPAGRDAVAGQATPTPPPSDAIVLFDGKNLDEWVNVKGQTPATWLVQDGVMVVHKPSGNIETKRKFTNYQLHLECRVPAGTTGAGQARGNSGVFLASTGNGDSGYELQVLDSYENKTYVNGQAGASTSSRRRWSTPCASRASGTSTTWSGRRRCSTPMAP